MLFRVFFEIDMISTLNFKPGIGQPKIFKILVNKVVTELQILWMTSVIIPGSIGGLTVVTSPMESLSRHFPL